MGVGSSRAHHYEIGRLGCDRHAQQGRAWVTIDHCPLDICRAHSSIGDDLQRRLSMHGGVIGQARVLEKADGVDYTELSSRCS